MAAATTAVADRPAENEALLRAGYAAFAAGDIATLQRTFDPDMVWHANRLGVLGGDHRGFGAVMQFFGRSAELTQGTFAVELVEVLANADGAAAVVRSKGRRGGATLDSLQIHLFHIRDGRVTEVWQLVDDGPAVDAFWS